MDFDLLAALAAGLTATVVMTRRPAPVPGLRPNRVGSHDPPRCPRVQGKDWGAMTPAGLVMGHAVYGVVAALVYSWVA